MLNAFSLLVKHQPFLAYFVTSKIVLERFCHYICNLMLIITIT